MDEFLKTLETRAQEILAEQPRGLNGDLDQFEADLKEEIENHAKLVGIPLAASTLMVLARRNAQMWHAHNELACLVHALIEHVHAGHR